MELEIGTRLRWAMVDWLAGLRGRLAEAVRAGRLPHAVLLLGQQGAGQSEIAWWLAGLLLCRRDQLEPCGDCADCRLFQAGTHPDFHRVAIEEEATVIRVEQVRDLGERLATRSYRGRGKVALIDPADGMNINAFNALLKTLEEPPDDTVLLLAACRGDRLPATIRSRCSVQRLPLPPAPLAIDWLQREGPAEDWPRLLRLAQGAPFLAAQQAAAGLAELDAQMRTGLDGQGSGALDVIGLADAWRSDRPELRLAWLELWLTDRLRQSGQGSDTVNNNGSAQLPVAVDLRMIRAGHRLLDALREARQRIGGSLNVQLLLENLLVDLNDWTRSETWRGHRNRSTN